MGTARPSDHGIALRRRLFLGAAALQFLCLLIFLFDVLSEINDFNFGTAREWFGVVALAIGGAITLREYLLLMRRNHRISRTLDAASGAFQAVLDEHFTGWGLTAAERDVALLTVKGLSNTEIADLRATKTGTIKAQTAAIYRKAGVAGRAELIAVVIEDLVSGIGLDIPAA